MEPTWPADAVLTVSNLKSTSLTLSWPAASDDVAVSSYVILVDDVEVLTVDGTLVSTTVPNLKPTGTYLLTVLAVDPAGNQSTPLKVTETTPDGGPPLWPGGKLSASEVSNYSALLSWTPAVDDVGVTGYRVFQDGAQVSELTGTQFEVNNLDPAIDYDFKVEAGDAAGNWSTTGPSVSVTTTKVYDPGFMRLSKEQYNRTLGDLMGYMKEKYCTGLPNTLWRMCKSWSSAGSWYGILTGKTYGQWADYQRLYVSDNVEPTPGELRGGYRRFDQVIHNEHVTSWLQATMKVAQVYFEDDIWDELTGESTKWGGLGWGDWMVFTPCNNAYEEDPALFDTETAMYEACVSNFITDFGLRAYRQPLSDEEHAYLLGIYQAVDQQYVEADFIDQVQDKESSLAFNRAARGLRNVIAVVLTAPKFLFRMELGNEDGNLTAYELASRLSYHFWNSMPDTELFEAAADGSLMTAKGYQAQLDRLALSSKAKPVIDEFYRDYLRVEEIPDLNSQDGASKAVR
ncbi:MAG TPA: DUF1592 domain-containing protein [Myxococcales bacterium]|nr:DUF1592 domain-containing protein [Myxococcales bacterium]